MAASLSPTRAFNLDAWIAATEAGLAGYEARAAALEEADSTKIRDWRSVAVLQQITHPQNAKLQSIIDRSLRLVPPQPVARRLFVDPRPAAPDYKPPTPPPPPPSKFEKLLKQMEALEKAQFDKDGNIINPPSSS